LGQALIPAGNISPCASSSAKKYKGKRRTRIETVKEKKIEND
jgi:hypothetical protein